MGKQKPNPHEKLKTATKTKINKKQKDDAFETLKENLSAQNAAIEKLKKNF